MVRVENYETKLNLSKLCLKILWLFFRTRHRRHGV